MAEISDSEKLLAKSVTVELDGKTYVFKLPTPRDYVQIGLVARKLRAKEDPDSNGSTAGLDPETVYMFNAMATFVVLYEKGDNDWVVTPGDASSPVIDPLKWGFGVPFIEVFVKFTEELSKF
jgi:hypothetical protein